MQERDVDLKRLRIDRGGRRGRRPRRRRIVRWAVWIAVLGAAAFLLRRPIGRLYRSLTLPAVSVVQATKTSPLAASAVAGTAANGYVVAARRAALSADTPGRVVEMNVEEGSVVRKGDVVARLYAEEYEAALRRAEAELEAARSSVRRLEAELQAARSRLDTRETDVRAAEARLADAEALVARRRVDLQRARELVEKGAGTQQDVDDEQTRLDRAIAGRNAQQALLENARSRVAEAEADVAVAEANLGEVRAQLPVREAARDQAAATLAKTEVRAPFDGIVVLKDAEVGEVVSPNSQGGNSRGAVVTMVDFDSLEVQVDMPERTLANVQVGTRANIYLDAYPDERYTGRISRIWPTANRQKGSVELRVRFDEPDEKLRPELGVRVVFLAEEQEQPEGGEAERVVLVPREAVVRVDGRTGVFRVERDVARFQAVTLGEERGGRVVVEEGLEGGETLVSDPPLDLSDGERVRVVP